MRALRAAILSGMIFVAATVPVLAQGASEIGQAIEQKYHVHGEHVPMLGMVNVMLHGFGAHGLSLRKVLDFEGFAEPVDASAMEQLVETHAGAGWERIVRSSENHGAELSLIYVRTEGKKVGMLVVDLEGRNVNLVQLSMNASLLAESIDRYAHHHRHHDGPEHGA